MKKIDISMNSEAVLVILFSLLSFNCVEKNNTITGNWMSIDSNSEKKIHTEIYIDDETFNVFSEEVNDIIFSNYYIINHEKLFLLDNEKNDTIVEFAYEVDDSNLKLTSENLSSSYVRISNENSLNDYINNSISKKEYLENFIKRKKNSE